jgi:hypothetical protein
LHQGRHMLLQSPQARADLAIEDIDAVLQVLPKALHWIQLGAVGWQPDQDDILRDLDALGHMRGRLVQNDDMKTRGLGLPTLPQQDGEAIRIEARQLPPKGLARGRLDGGIEPGILLQRCDHLHWFHPVARQPPVPRQVQAQACCLLAADPHRLGGRLPASGRDRPEAAWALFDKVRRLGDLFLAWLGRGRLRLAGSW